MRAKSLILLAALALSMDAARAEYCEGLMIGSEPGLTDIMKNGRVQPDFDRTAPALPSNTLGREAFSSHFYIRKEGKPVEGNVTVDHTNAYSVEIMHPVIKGDQFKEQREGDYVINNTISDIIIDYNCNELENGGTSIIFMEIFIDTEEAAKACGAPTHREPYRVHVVWTKFCGAKLLDDRGVSLGTLAGSNDVVRNGVTEPGWALPSASATTDAAAASQVPAKLVYSAQPNTTFFIQTNDGSTQSFGTPRFENDDSKLIVMLGSTFDGGVLSPKPKEIVVHYLCDVTAKSPVEITMIIDLCAKDVPPSDCDSDRNTGYDPIVVHWKKNCGVEDGSEGMNSRQVVAITLICVAFSMCAVASCYRYVKMDKRGAEIVPMGPELERAFVACWNAVMSFVGGESHRYEVVGRERGESSEGITMAIGKKMKSSSGEVTVRFGGTSRGGAFQGSGDADTGTSTYGAANGSASMHVPGDGIDSNDDGIDSNDEFDNADI